MLDEDVDVGGGWFTWKVRIFCAANNFIVCSLEVAARNSDRKLRCR